MRASRAATVWHEKAPLHDERELLQIGAYAFMSMALT
jgi:hypothetical protein